MLCLQTLLTPLLDADVSEINLGVTLRKSWILADTLHSTFVSLTACMEVEVLKSSLHQSRSDVKKYVRLTIRQYCNRLQCGI